MSSVRTRSTDNVRELRSKRIKLETDDEEEGQNAEVEVEKTTSESPSRYKCKVCGKGFPNPARVISHRREKHGLTPDPGRRKSVDPILRHSPPPQRSGKRVSRPSVRFVDVMDNGLDVKPSKRRFDDLAFQDDADENESDEELGFKCNECEAVFNTRRGLVVHGVHKHKHKRQPDSVLRRSAVHFDQSLPAETAESESEESFSSDEAEDFEDEFEPSDQDEDRENVEKMTMQPPKVEKVPPRAVSQIMSPPQVKVIGNMCGLEQEEEDADEDELMDEDKLAANKLADEEEEDEEVENYPCNYCQGRVFLTSFGLERHTKMSHPQHVQQVNEDIKRLQQERAKKIEAKEPIGPALTTSEMERRADALRRLNRIKEEEKSRRGRVAKAVRVASPAADKENEPDDDDDQISDDGALPIEIARRQRKAVVSRASFTLRRPTGRRRRSDSAAKAKYQSCDVCGILINTDHPRAMLSHTKAHQKNDELRQELLRLYGPGWVDNVTCRECNLVFKDEEKLEQHRRNVHVRRRHFLCRFCGDVFRNMRDLNLHKERRHNAFEGHRRHPDMLETVGYQRRISMVADSYEAAPNITMEGEQGGPASRTASVADAGNAEEFSCRTVCEVCGMHMVRPSNLIRHMKLAHNRTSFTATVETKGMPPFKADSQGGHFLWGCCDEIYDDRHAFIAHRRSAHGPQAYAGAPRECEHCGMMFRNNLLYINHLQTHRPRPCNVCGHAFTAASAVDSSLYRAHMQRHSEKGFAVNMPQITEELAQKGVDPYSDTATRLRERELAREDDELDDRGCSGDEYSIFSESGVESECDDAVSTCDDKDDVKLLTVCPVCGKSFDCVFRFGDHWSLHCTPRALDRAKIKSRPYSFKEGPTLHRYKCSECRAAFVRRSSLALHYLSCRLKRFGRRRYRAADVVEETASRGDLSSRDESLASPTKIGHRRFGTLSPLKKRLNDDFTTATPAAFVDDKSPSLHNVASAASSLTSEARIEMEDSIDVELAWRQNGGDDGVDAAASVGDKKRREIAATAYLPEKAFVVAWHTSRVKAGGAKPYVCLTCDRMLSDFVSLVAHVNAEHVDAPLFADGLKEPPESSDDEGDATESRGGEGAKIALKDGGVGGESANEKAASDLDAEGTLQESSGEKCKVTEECKAIEECKPIRAILIGVKRAPLLHEGRFACSVCRKRFHRRSLLDEHVHLWHGKIRPIRCDLCGKSYWTSYGLKKHLKRHDISQFYCNNCDKRFVSYETLTKHQTVHELTYSVYQCEDCVQSLYGLAQLKKHFAKNHPGINIVSCPVCARIHTDLMGLNEHFAAEHSATRSKCAICFKYFRTPMLVREHVRKAHRHEKLMRRPMQCKKCGKWLPNAGKLAVHDWRHRCGKHFQCSLCDYMASNDELIRQHLETAHDVNWIDSRDLIVDNRLQRPLAI